MTRSYLFVPGDSEKKLQKAADSAADALIVDLEDSVDAEARPRAREIAGEFLRALRSRTAWVRINPLDSADAHADLQAVMAAAPVGIVVPKIRRAAELVRFAGILERIELQHGVETGSTAILPVSTEHPEALFHLHEYAESTPRLAGLTWGAEDLGAFVGAAATRDEAGDWLPPYQLARSLCLFAAAAAEIPAIDTVYTDFRNQEGLASYAARAKRDGFSGMLAIHPGQVAVINDAFEPSRAEVEKAQRIVELFAAHPGAGTLGMDGEMLDRPHWLRACRVLEMAGRKDAGGEPG